MLKLVAAGVLPASGGLVQLACSQGGYRPEFFSAGQLALVDDLSDLILPADERSRGARAALVARYIDVTVADASEDVQLRWRSGLEALGELCHERFGTGFAACSPEQQNHILADLAAAEEDPASGAERFFALVKRATIDGYYTSEVGIHEELQYEGNTAVDEFPGCAHERHGQA